jgi:hypothetical protein
LTIARVGNGALSVAATAPTAKGARAVIVDGNGTAYVPDTQGGRLIVVSPPTP